MAQVIRDTEVVSIMGVQGRSGNESSLGWRIFSGEYDRVAVSTTFRQQPPSTRNKSKKGSEGFCV